jgi:hypothetical protein
VNRVSAFFKRRDRHFGPPTTSARSSASREFASEPVRIGSYVTPICCMAAPLFTAHSGGRAPLSFIPSHLRIRDVYERSYGASAAIAVRSHAARDRISASPTKKRFDRGLIFKKCDFGTSPNELEYRGGQDG